MWRGRIQSEKINNDRKDEGTGEGEVPRSDAPTRGAGDRGPQHSPTREGSSGRRITHVLAQRVREEIAPGTH